jgi:hypothetical protein
MATKNEAVAAHAAGRSTRAVRGGHRETTLRSRYTAQIIGMDEPAVKRRIVALGKVHGISQSEILRLIIAAGIGKVERDLERRSVAPEPDDA